MAVTIAMPRPTSAAPLRRPPASRAAPLPARAKKLKLRQLHPDKNHDDPEATAKTQRILRASEVLLEKHFNTSQSRSSAIAVLCP